MIFNNQGIIIPDISFWQDNDSTPQKVDFHKMKSAGAAGVIIRAGQNSWADEDFKDHWRAAKAAGLPRGSYWFFDSRAEPGSQATLWKAQIDNDLPELGLWVDLEESYNGTWRGERNRKTFIEAVHIMFPGVRVGIYTANWWWQIQPVTDQAYFSQYDLWVSQYTSSHLYVVLPKPWENKGARLWQFTAKGDGPKYGAESLNIDLNYWNGDMDSYRNYFKLSGDPEPPIETGETMWYRVNTAKLQIRTGPGISYLDTGDLFAGDRIETAGGPLGGWLHISRIFRVSEAVEVKDGWCSGAYCVPIAPEPPTEPPAVTLKHTVKVYSDGSIQIDNGAIIP